MNMRTKFPNLRSLTAVSMLAVGIIASYSLHADENKSPANKNENNAVFKPWISDKVPPSKLNIDLRELKNSDKWIPGKAIKDMPRRRLKPDYVPPEAPRNPVLIKNDRLMSLQKIVSKSVTKDTRVIEQQFDGSGYTGVNPPDTTGDVGLDYYIQSINGSSGSIFTIYDKENGDLVSGPTNMETLGSGNCASGAGDPIVLFDEMANRWLLSEFSSFGNNLCVYISQTSDPITGGWFAYSFTAPSFPDYPKYGVGVDAYYVGTNELTSAVYALDRTAMLSGDAASMIRLSIPDLNGFGFQMIQPADHDGVADMPAGTPGYFLRHRDDEVHNAASNNPNEDYVELWEFVADFDNVSNASISKVADFAVSEFDSDLCGLFSFSCFPQAGSSATLDPLREVVMFRAQYRNFGNYETIVGNFVTDVDGTDHGGVRWFELRRQNSLWRLEQEGTYSPDDKNRWMGSIAMDKDGNIALAYSWGSSTDFPGIRYTGRLADDAAGVMTEAEAVLVAGTSGNSSNRWGDYSHLSLDPEDECTFWYTNQYGRQNGQWGTHISSFKFDSCDAGSGGNQDPIANFTSSCSLLSCTFDASASSDNDGSIVSYNWDFGDGSTATGSNVTYNYTTDGGYNVRLTVVDDEGALGIDTQTINVTSTNQVPIAAFSFVTTELTVAFTDSSLDSDGTITDWNWDFGDGETSSLQNPTHNYANAGTYIVSLSVTDNGAATTNTSESVAVDLNNVPPISNFTYTVDDLSVSFFDSSSDSDGIITAWNWDFGDGNTSTEINPVQTYSAAGSFTVTLNVTDDSGATNASAQTVTVEDPNAETTGGFTESNVSPNAREVLSFSIDVPAGATLLEVDISGGTGNADLAINFGSSPTQGNNDCLRTGLGNNHNCSISNPQAGTYFISVRGAIDSSGIELNAYWFAAASENISPVSDFSFTTNELEVTFTDTSNDADGLITAWSWNFGNGSSSALQNPIHNFVAAGSYTVNLTVTDDEGATGTTNQIVVVSESGEASTGGFTETGISPALRQNILFTLDVPAGADLLEVDTFGGSGDANLIINFGSEPTRTDNDCIELGAGNTHSCSIANPAAGTWYIFVRGGADSSDVTLNAFWTIN